LEHSNSFLSIGSVLTNSKSLPQNLTAVLLPLALRGILKTISDLQSNDSMGKRRPLSAKGWTFATEKD
jgi:hypothetical protein